MSASANVKAIEALESLRQSLMRFQHEAASAMNAAALEIKRTLDWLQERLRFWQHELYRREQALQRATKALQVCLSSGRYDPQTGRAYAPDCSSQQRAVMEVQHRVREAEQELRIVQEQMRRIEEAIKNYQRQADRLAGKLNTELQRGSLLLERSSSILYSYVSGGNVSSNEGVATGSGTIDEVHSTLVSSLRDIFANSSTLKNMTPQQVMDLANTEGWSIGTLGKGSHAGEGLIVREIDNEGNLTGRLIQWHPGGGHHGPNPYWKISSPKTGTIRIGL